ncbi:Uncharacterised protein [Moraxella caprae]|uniref:Uncharacterized protein n=1 Tax=Moraxella caprae TaxID=90240 RepID=A0A378U6N8_9GAMM|nr:hypothetical protein [Moraxella caprae]STZ70284.1 Uncharacterised protein [Moraxella caprae]
MFTLDDGRTVKGTVVNGDTKYYYTNQEGDITGERYEVISTMSIPQQTMKASAFWWILILLLYNF